MCCLFDGHAQKQMVSQQDSNRYVDSPGGWRAPAMLKGCQEQGLLLLTAEHLEMY